jgi:hypothetical protein
MPYDMHKACQLIKWFKTVCYGVLLMLNGSKIRPERRYLPGILCRFPMSPLEPMDISASDPTAGPAAG